MASPSQTEYRNPVFGQVSLACRMDDLVLFIYIKGFSVCNVLVWSWY